MVLKSWFNVILDTTPPVLKLYAPSYVQYGDLIEFIVVSNEKFHSNLQNAYVMFGDFKYDIVLNYNEENNEYIGVFQSNIKPTKECVICISLYDAVGNQTDMQHHIELFSNKKINIEYKVDSCNIKVKSSKAIEMKANKMVVDMYVDIE